MVETAVTVRKYQQEPAQRVTVTTDLLGLVHTGRILSLLCTHLKQACRQCEKFCWLFLGIKALKRHWVWAPHRQMRQQTELWAKGVPKMSKSLHQLQQRFAVQYWLWTMAQGMLIERQVTDEGCRWAGGRRAIMQLNRRETHTVRGTGGAPHYKPAACSRMQRCTGTNWRGDDKHSCLQSTRNTRLMTAVAAVTAFLTLSLFLDKFLKTATEAMHCIVWPDDNGPRQSCPPWRTLISAINGSEC